MLFHACLLALSHSGRHERTTAVCILLPAVQGRWKAVLLCLRYVDNVAFGAWFVPSWCAQKKSRFKHQKLRGCLCSSEAIWLAELMIQLALTVSSQEEHLPNSHVHVAVGTPQGHDLD